MPVICVDAGTTLVKAVGYDDSGSEVVVVREATPVSRPRHGWAEQDMLAVRRAVVRCIRGVVADVGTRIDFLAVTGQGDGCWLVDAAGVPTGPAILWNDGRAVDIVSSWDGVASETFALNGSIHFAGLPNAILTWLKLHDPDRLARSARSLTCGGWVFGGLTDSYVIDASDAAAPFLDIRRLQYSDELLRLYGMEWASSLLPPVLAEAGRVQGLTAAAAAEVGLRVDTPVVLSSYDIASTAIGVGAVAAGRACSILGTTLCTETVTDHVALSAQPAGITIPLGLPGLYLRGFPTLAGGEVIDWACRLLGLVGPSELGDLAATCTKGAAGLAFQPYLSPAGERAPFLDPAARGALLGLSLDHGRDHFARAVLEGLSLVVLDCLEASGTPPTELRVCGGGAASDVWLQLLADMCGVVVVRSADAEAGARGAFLVGSLATGRETNAVEAAARYVRPGATFVPDATARAFYAQAYDDFRALRGVTAAGWPLLGDARRRVEQAEQAPS